MYGVVGYLSRAGLSSAPIGRIAYNMLHALSPTSPDSTGVALFLPAEPGRVNITVKVEGDDLRTMSGRVIRRIGRKANVVQSRITGQALRIVIEEPESLAEILEIIEGSNEHGAAECISMGRRLTLIKDVGPVDRLEEVHDLMSLRGTHMIGQARLATESRVDISHSQPFWARPRPDMAVAHTGQVTNYHKLRRKYEAQGRRFVTTNDAEVIGVFLAQEMENGATLQDAMRESLHVLDGTYAYVAATENALGVAKDFMGARPLVVGETDEFVVISSEASAICSGIRQDVVTWEPDAKEVHVWPVQAPVRAATR